MLELVLVAGLAAALVGVSTLAGRRWGHQVAGLVGAFPLIVGPVLLLAAERHGAEFAARTAAATLSESATSAFTACARPPFDAMASATSCASSRRRSAMKTAKPSAASPSAAARPIPRPPPVTSATRGDAPFEFIGSSYQRSLTSASLHASVRG
jgi:hypothetical protein